MVAIIVITCGVIYCGTARKYVCVVELVIWPKSNRQTSPVHHVCRSDVSPHFASVLYAWLISNDVVLVEQMVEFMDGIVKGCVGIAAATCLVANMI